MILLILGLLATASASPASDNKDTYKDQYRRSDGRTKEISSGEDNCTDPRTMRKHAAYTEWADAYSCTRHRCQPGGRNLAIYTVGCKRVEAPESAIECEEVVEDTNMQFPFCCTRLRCLVVVRGEVWTRVLGQPWEVLPAAPWSHMYKMKKPPPSDTTFLPKINEQGPIYELSEPETDSGHDKVLRSAKKPGSDSPDCNEVVPRAAAPPDIVIALSTTNDVKEHKRSETRRSQINPENSRHKRARKTTPSANQYFEEDRDRERERENRHPIEPEIQEIEEMPLSTEKPIEASEERFYANAYGITQKPTFKNAHHQVAWTEIPQNQWNEHESMDLENRVSEPNYHQPEVQAQEAADKSSANSISNKEEKPSNLQALVDAIGTRMRDIESVVQRMSEKVHQVKPPAGTGGVEASGEKRRSFLTKDDAPPKKSSHVHGRSRCSRSGKSSRNRRSSSETEELHYGHKSDTKRPNSIADDYKRFSMRNKGSKYLHSTDSTTDVPLFIEDNNPNGYFSDASNSVLRRSNPPKEPPLTYMAPVENRRKAPAHIAVVSDNSDDAEKKRKKHSHKKRRNKNGHHSKKHHSKDDKRKHFNKLSSVETDKNIVSLEDSSAIANK